MAVIKINKMLIFPLGILIILTILNASFTGVYTGGNVTTNISGAGTTQGNIWSMAAILLVLGAAIIAGTIAGVNFLGSGLSDTSQSIIFNAILFLGLWGILSFISTGLLFGSGPIIVIFWIVLTIIFVLGLATHIGGGSDDVG